MPAAPLRFALAIAAFAAALFLPLCTAHAADHGTFTLAPAEVDRRMVVMRASLTLNVGEIGPSVATGPDGAILPIQAWQELSATAPQSKEYSYVWMVPFVAKGASPTFTLSDTRARIPGGVEIEEKDGYLSFLNSPAGENREITRYYFGDLATKYKRPYFYPLNVGKTNLVRGFPMDPHAGEQDDHPHHTGLWFGHGDIDKADYWIEKPVVHEKFLAKESGKVFARIVSQDRWSENLQETRDVTIYDAGQDVVMDWSITLSAVGKPVVLGQTKEGGFSVRVATELTSPEPSGNNPVGRGTGKMIDALGNEGEPAIRAKTAPWADNYGVIVGQAVGVALMAHPTSFRAPPDWHVRNYGLFAASTLMNQKAYTIDAGKSITLIYRVFAHHGNPKDAHVADVYAGFADTRLK